MSIFFICSIAAIALRPVGGRVGKQIDQHRGHDLPGHSVPILQPVALLCLGVAAFGQVVPVVVHFGLGPAFDDNRDCLVELEVRAAVQRLGVRPVELKRDRQCRAFRLAGGLSTFLVVAQGGADLRGGEADANGKPVALQVQAGEKFYQNFDLSISDDGGQSSRPQKHNPTSLMGAALELLGAYTFLVAVNDSTRSYFKVQSILVTPAVAADMRAVLRNPADDAAASRLWDINPNWNGILRTTCMATMINHVARRHRWPLSQCGGRSDLWHLRQVP
jgi:hypothetical protein